MRAGIVLSVVVAGVTLLVALLPSLRAQDRPLCSPVASRGEGHFPLAESEFTQTEALRALEALAVQIESVQPEADIALVDNALMMIQGYLLKSYASSEADYLDYFCQFMRDEAYVRH